MKKDTAFPNFKELTAQRGNNEIPHSWCSDLLHKKTKTVSGEGCLTQSEREEDVGRLPGGHVTGSEPDKAEEGMTNPGTA